MQENKVPSNLDASDKLKSAGVSDEFLQKNKGNFIVTKEIKRFNAATGERLSTPHVTAFPPALFIQTAPNMKRLGYTIEVLYDPTEYLKEQSAIYENSRKALKAQQVIAAQEAAEAQKELEWKAKEYEREQMRKEIEAEIRSKLKAEEVQPKVSSRSNKQARSTEEVEKESTDSVE